MRVLFDTVIYNRWVDEAALATMIDAAIADKRITLVETHIQEDQLSATSDEERRAILLGLIGGQDAERANTSVAVWDVSSYDQADWSSDSLTEFYEQVLGNTERGNPRHAKDALLAATAATKADVFVTADRGLEKRLRNALLNSGRQLTVWSQEEFCAFLAGTNA